MSATTTERAAGVPGTFAATFSQVPVGTPTLTIYSDLARTVVAVPTTDLVPTANPTVWTAAYPAALAPGTYLLSFLAVYTAGQPPKVNADDTLVLTDPAVLVALRPAWAPSAQDVADVLAQRVLQRGGRAVGTFTADTVPTEAAVLRLGTSVAREIELVTGTIPATLIEHARAVAALGTAARVLLSFFPGENTTHDDIAAAYASALAGLKESVKAAAGGPTTGAPARPGGAFPLPMTTLTERW